MEGKGPRGFTRMVPFGIVLPPNSTLPSNHTYTMGWILFFGTRMATTATTTLCYIRLQDGLIDLPPHPLNLPLNTQQTA